MLGRNGKDSSNFSRENSKKCSGRSVVVSLDTAPLVVSHLQLLTKLSIRLFYLHELLVSIVSNVKTWPVSLEVLFGKE